MFDTYLNRPQQPAYSIDGFIEALYLNADDDTPLTIYFDGEYSRLYVSPEIGTRCSIDYSEQSLLDPECFILKFCLDRSGDILTCRGLVSFLREAARGYDNFRIDRIEMANGPIENHTDYIFTKNTRWTLEPASRYGSFAIVGKTWASWKQDIAGPF